MHHVKYLYISAGPRAAQPGVGVLKQTIIPLYLVSIEKLTPVAGNDVNKAMSELTLEASSAG